MADDQRWEWSDVLQAWARVIKPTEVGLLIQQRPDGFHILSEQDIFDGRDPGVFGTLEEAQVAAQKFAMQFVMNGIRRRD